MAGEYGVILKVVEPIKSFVFDSVREYVGYIGSCEDNLGALRKRLSEVCDKKDDIKKKVKEGNDKQEEITREAASWLKDVRILTEDEELKGVMYKDIETAKFVVKLMGKKVLKRRISDESEMQELVVKVMKKLKEDMDKSEEEMRKIVEVDYKQVAEVAVDVMKDTIEEFKKLLKEDKKMAAIATRTLKDRDLDKLTKGDREMEEIVREAGYASDEELCPNQEEEGPNTLQPLLVKTPDVDVNKNSVREAAKRLFKPLANLVTPLGKLMDDANFKKAVPEAEGVKLGLEVIDGLLIRGRGLQKERNDNTRQHRVCCCSSLARFHARYLISKAAEFMANYIQNELITNYPTDPVTLRLRTSDLKPIPTQFLVGLNSRTQLLHQILEKLNDDGVNSIGVFGMGGIGKTTLAKEVTMRVKDVFTITVMVEVSDAPDVVRIQAAIAESIDLPLHDVNDVAQRAVRLYNRLISEKEKKVLVVLDNVWKKLNLDEIGIPHTCKLFLTTRDREVCRVMDVRDVNILEVGVLNANEARELFRSQAGNQVDVREFKNVVARLLRKCGGLPLAIIATANSLKDKDLFSWEKFADDSDKPISSQTSGAYRHTLSILNTSYKFIQANEKRIFFLLACLFPLGSSASIEKLMRYGMGLCLFEHVNELSEAMEQAVTWVNELILSSMLVEGGTKGDVKIHDIVRNFAVAYAAKEEEHKFMVEGIPRWLEDDTLKKYTAMSLTSKNDYFRLSGVEACKLQILILKGDLSPSFDDFFFDGMVNLLVLDLSRMNFEPSLPESMRKLKKLRTLCLESCRLGNIELVGELVNLLVLSLRKSSLEKLPNEVANLCKLRLLDLSGCTSSKSGCTSSKFSLVPTGVLGKLSRLEGLYMYNNSYSVFEMKPDSEEANATEYVRLPYLNALEVRLAATEEMPFDGQFLKNVDKFRICVGDCSLTGETLQKFGCLLNFEYVADMSGFLEKSCLKLLLKKADFLEVQFSDNFESLVPQLDQEGFRSLRSLDLHLCNDIKWLLDGRTMTNLMAFPCLQSLNLMELKSLEMLCKSNGDVLPGTFSNLETIKLCILDKLVYILPLVPRMVNEIYVSSCPSLKFMFIEDEDLSIELPFLKLLQFDFVPSLLSLVGPKNVTSDALQGPQCFFGPKIVLPSLELLQLRSCSNVVNLWSKEIYTPGFQSLKDIKISDCGMLSSVGSPSIFSILVQLETLSIEKCKEMRQVISAEETEESEIGEQIIRFPQLKNLELDDLKNLESFYNGGSKLEFPKLTKLILGVLRRMISFVMSENSSALFNEKIDVPCLEELRVVSVNDDVMGLWDKQSLSVMSNPAPMLRQLALDSSSKLRKIPSVVLEKLSSLTLSRFENDAVFSSADLGEEEGSALIYSQLPNLQELNVDHSKSLKELFGKQGNNAIDDALTSFCGQVKTLVLNDLPSLNLIPLHLFKSIASLTLYGLRWHYLLSAHLLEDSLHELQSLTIEDCHNMEALLIDVGSHIKLPKLKQLHLRHLMSLIGIVLMPKKEAVLFLPSLESLVIEQCYSLEHFWSGSILAPRLQDLYLKSCGHLKQFFVGSLVDTIVLESLQKVSFVSCGSIMSISSGSLTTPKLREVELWDCENMKCVFQGNPNHDGDLLLPSLEIVDIGYCSNLRAFSLRPVLAPKVTQVTHDRKEYSMLSFDDLNHFLQKINPVPDS